MANEFGDEGFFLEDESQLESEKDINISHESFDFSSIAISASDWTTETIVGQIDKGNILLSPDFQRRDAWDPSRKSRFIESLILGFPIPQIVLAESKTKKGSYIVLDGKQRLLSIRQFFATAGQNETYNKLALKGLVLKDDLNGKTIESLRGDPRFENDVASLENQTIRTVVIKNWKDERFLYHVFLRLNTGSVPLSPQELRQALHPGPFVNFLEKKSTDSAPLREILKIKSADFRMRDSELLLRYFAFKNFLTDYKGDLKDFLDTTCKFYNDQWSTSETLIEQQYSDFVESHNVVKEIFGKNAYRKWTGKQYESRFNRAVFDVMILAFAELGVRDLAVGHYSQIEEAYKEVCNETAFLTSVESTTKSIDATVTRLALWYEKLNGLIGSRLGVPHRGNGSIVVKTAHD
ncbi:DUF262 domain-containing protein [Pseudomonas sp.]|uniref:DUF262 domain-containing protein n=1 Tax=Pseudomonas sp. TaxID=306 RepID=UPI000E830556|nr:DUF262 domain-containing protein [Pseudomonas sp.]HBP49318.1 DUF262 domain-containing protein [Pseudomonas sp.]